ncbi:peptidoglycan recognition protein family protein [Streptomyces eurocidicus]|uniref:N-acetylmuramoyl-L-alanine amidase domain-containing protein n=1 Tax=Streptomyces eurocidicus TaxID=66423 RepID=A0A7W8BEA0_STREU|nr:N-acetylmuramoyl-L-alanine amidase [Streptomyces eurocidicus]MBB5121223.1 hypothetical protein [Streptomyces eurocidicus]MBF6055832.1 hypothetical protein [Streptomyces eurocidicus]
MLAQYVSTHDRAWPQGDGNAEWESVETSGFSGKALTTAQIDAVTRICQWGIREHGWPLKLADSPQDVGLGTHIMGGASWGGHSCPGPTRSNQRRTILARIRELA